ncbi:MAG: 3-oxoacyl-ACP reductase FabG [Actinobacteria bacterium]|nr:3-oxoacyl-ACP reductase FabG [Actinomycetota bacterium]
MTSRSVLVTGGNRGIGLAIALAFQAQGDQVAITYRSGDLPEGLFGVQADVTDTESVERAFAEAEAAHGPVEILVANAGITRDGLVLRMSDKDFIDVVNTNLTGVFRCARRATKSMLKLKRGRIIIIGSVVGHSGSAGQVNYASTKAGLVGMARSLARELGVRGITTNVIAPGFVTTDMTAVLDENIKKEILNTIPLNRYAEASEVAGVAIFLASDSAAYITGAVIPVDGGLGMGN